MNTGMQVKAVHLELLVEMVVPVAMMSGFMRPSSVGPMDEKYARLSKRSVSITNTPLGKCSMTRPTVSTMHMRLMLCMDATAVKALRFEGKCESFCLAFIRKNWQG